MKLKRLEIHNYKSLRNVVIEPGPLSVFVGPNASGKSNLVDALDFLSEVYRWDLEGAVKKKGGFENICFRQSTRSSDEIQFRVVLEIESKFRKDGQRVQRTGLLLDHRFRLRVGSDGTRSSFAVPFEDLSVSSIDDPVVKPIFRVRRSGQKVSAKVGEHGRKDLEVRAFEKEDVVEILQSWDKPAGLFMEVVVLVFPWASVFSKRMAALRVLQLSPRHCREPGVPTPNADLDRFGGNLPAVIDYLKGHVPDAFGSLLQAVQRVMPSLESIETDFIHTKRLALFLKESGVEQSWTAEDISDGTIQAIALLAATFDPRIKILVVEEPENGVHPWAIRNFVEAFREASASKQIFLTTHSPILIDQIRLEELWVVQRPELETEIDPVLELDPSLRDAWNQGKFTLSEYLDSGALPAAVPPPGL